MAQASDETDLGRACKERDLYRQLLELDACESFDPFLKEALALVVNVTRARQGYLEVRAPGAEAGEWSIAHGCSSGEIEDIQGRISRGIIARSISTGETIQTPSALLDPEFGQLESVREHRIEAVLCAPIGGDAALGVLYLQGHEAPGPFASEHRELVELFSRHLAPIARRVLERERSRSESDPTLAHRAKVRAEDVVGRSRALAEVLRQVTLVAPLDVSVLLTGESGTGKSQIARVIHENGPRSARPFVELNCAAIPESLLESELFGARRGAYSGADRDIEGKVAGAEGGTLFLDEIGELPMNSQAKLLQLLQSGEYYPLGSNRSEQANIRVIAASNVDLAQAVDARRFREDLYYRLQVLPIRLPSLKEREDDVLELAGALGAAASERHGLPRLEFSPAALAALRANEWPGNVRQLGNAVEAACIYAAGEGAAAIEPRHLFPDLAAEDGEPDASFQEATRRFQKSLVERTLRDCDWNVAEAARRLDLARSHVYNLINGFDLKRETE